FGGFGWSNRLARGHEGPSRRITKCKIEIRHDQTAIGIPHAALAHVQQAISSFCQHLAAVDKAQVDGLSFLWRFAQNHSDLVIPIPCQLRSLYRRVLNELDEFPILLHSLNLQEAGQFEDQETRSIMRHIETQFYLGIKLLWRSYTCVDHIIAHEDRILTELFFGQRYG